MRTLVALILIASAAQAQDRTWTIATTVQTVEAELLSIRGDVVYLKIGDKVESFPLARLSVADHEFISSLSLAPLRLPTGPSLPAGDLPIPVQFEELTPPGGVAGTGTAVETLPAPPTSAATPPSGGSGAVRSNGNRSSGVSSCAERLPTARAIRQEARGTTSTSGRRSNSAPTNQLQNGQRNNSDSNPGILGIRERRADRTRGAATWRR